MFTFDNVLNNEDIYCLWVAYQNGELDIDESQEEVEDYIPDGELPF